MFHIKNNIRVLTAYLIFIKGRFIFEIGEIYSCIWFEVKSISSFKAGLNTFMEYPEYMELLTPSENKWKFNLFYPIKHILRNSSPDNATC